MSSSNSRKRAAPGASPVVPIPQQQQMQQPYTTDNASGDALTRWNPAGDASGFIDDGTFGSNAYGFMPNQQYPQAVPTPSNAVARRQMNNALVPASQRGAFDATDPWGNFGTDGTLIQQPGATEEAPEQDSIEKLEDLAQKVKREAQKNRKQIPPFVQKLSSFLEERKNEELIRWSDDGDSFIVLDEDEFAKKLIPELFKHNNYASFVRQLNMYGFHKCVGLSDNSMRASERKNKSPSEYSNPYFKRGRPNLLWLINKSKTGKSTTKRGASKGGDGDAESDEEAAHDDATSHQTGPSATAESRALPPADGGGPLQKKEMNLIREELQRVREQQKLILGAINRMQRNNNDLYNQALMFQNQHDRHQNSINAILNFLANVFRKTLEDQNNPQNVSDIISSMLNSQGQQSAQHGSVVDLGDFFQSQMDGSASLGGPPQKRARGLLPPIPDQNTPSQPSRSPSASYYGGQNSEMGHVTELVDSESPSLRQELENNPQERMMKIINDHNATNSGAMDSSKAAELVANAPNTLNNDQRSQLVNMMAGQGSPSQSGTPSGRMKTAAPSPTGASSTPPEQTAPSLSPIMRSPPMPAPSLNRINSNQEELTQLQRLQNEQDAKISELGDLLGPLSPSGRIPGLDNPEAYFDPPNVDLDQFFDSDAFLNGDGFGGDDGNDFNFNLDQDAGGNGEAGAEAKKDTPSSTGTEEIQREDFADTGTSTRGSKRQRTD